MADMLVVQRWLIRLGKYSSATRDPEDAADFVEEFAPMLAMRFPDERFNDLSLEFVAAELKFLPTYGELVAHLREWKQQLPAPSWPAINDNVIDLDPRERSWLSYFQRREAEGFPPLRKPDGRLSRPEITNWRAHELSVLRKNAPAAWEYLQRDNHAA